MSTYQQTLVIAVNNGITPARCGRCGQRDANWQTGHDDHRDPRYVGYQCCSCGHVQGMTRAAILRRVARQLR